MSPLVLAQPLPEQLQVITDDFDLRTITGADLVFAAVAVVSSFVLAGLARRTVRRLLGSVEGMPAMVPETVGRVVSAFLILLGLMVAIEALGFSLGPVGSILLILVVVLVLAARPLLQDVGASLILQLRQPFLTGDQVELLGHTGTVEEITARTIRLRCIDGRRIHVPNRSVLDAPIVNLVTEGRRMTTFVVGVDYRTDLDRAREVAAAALRSIELALDAPPPLVTVQEFSESTIDLACRFWHDPDVESGWRAGDEARRAVKRAFDAAGITIAFPQRVLWSGEEPT